ncbi:MAG: single-stranded DNA-binding protein [Nocardioidaceae bacterium]
MPKTTTADQPPEPQRATPDPDARNEVSLCGRVSILPEERDLPSGVTIVTGRIVVERDQAARKRSSQRVDTFDLVAWTTRPQRAMRSWQPGDVVAVDGAVRRRFFKGASGSVSRVEVEVRSARKVRSGP